MSVLSDYLNKCITEAGWRKTDVVDALHGRIDRGTVYRYLNGTHAASPPESALQAFADVLPAANIVELRAAVRVPLGTDTPWVPVPEANRLNSKQRQALDLFIKASVGGSFEDVEGGDDLDVPTDDELGKILDEVQRLRKVRPDLADAVLAQLDRTTAQEDEPADSRPGRSDQPR
jgi:hypothetical protein